MNLSLFSNPILVGQNKDILKIGGGNVYVGTDLGADVVIPYSLLNGKRGPYVAIGQPTYKNRDGQRRVSTLSVHLSAEAQNNLEKLVTVQFVKGEAKRLFKSDKIGDYELTVDGWAHKGDRAAQLGEIAEEDKGWLDEVFLAGKANRDKIDAAKATINAAVDASKSAPQQSQIQKSLETLANG